LNIRVIARLDIKGPNLVKGVQLEGLRVLGKPGRFAERYYHDGADELFFQDVVASLYCRNSLEDIIEHTAKRIFIPLCVGGGLRTLQDIRNVLRAGADKVALNTAAVRDPNLIRQAVRRFGSSTIVVAIEAIRQSDGGYEAFTDNGRERTGLDAFEWAERVATLGAGEILVTSVDRDGTGRGYDPELLRGVTGRVDIPVIALGGAGKTSHLVGAVKDGGVHAVAAASLFHYEVLPTLENASDEFDSNINLAAMKGGATYGRIRPASLSAAKEALTEAGISVRTPNPLAV
jgi:imidazole glycerol-phosphate synthase subunit HisF